MMTRTLLIAAAELVLLAAWVLYARRRARNHRPPLSRHPSRRTRTARGIPAEHPDAGYVLTSHERHRFNEVGMDSMVDVPEPTYQSAGEA